VEFLSVRGIDCSALRNDESFDGVRDMVLIGGATRTVFGWFGAFYAGTKRWTPPEGNDIAGARVVGIDPYFREDSEAAARLCRKLGRPYVTIDCAPDSPLHRGAAVTVISGEFIRNQFPATERETLLHVYTANSGGLVIFTSGANEILFARGGGSIGRVQPCRIVPKSTLGAGDTFRGGVIHAVACGWDDEQIVRFASATATSVCRRFPFAIDPPGLEEITNLGATLAVKSDGKNQI
jgi:sugar/nucleoside kinase (ribokinase family)